MRLGIRGMLATGLAGLLVVAGGLVALVVLRLVGHEAQAQVELQQRRRALEATERLRAACGRPEACGAALERTRRPDDDLLGVVALDPGHAVYAGPDAPAARRDPQVAEALRTRAPAWITEAGDTQVVVVPARLDDGRPLAFRFVFDLAPVQAAVAGRQRVVLLYLGFDLLAVLLFGLYLSGRYLVRPVRALTRATARVAGGALDPAVVPALHGPSELEALADAFRDMVARLRDQRDALTGHVDALQAARDDLVRSEKLATVGRLAAGLAHEVGNPLAAVLGYVEYLRDERGTPAALQAELLGRMDKELERIRLTVRQLLDFSRTEAPDPERLHLAQVLDSARELVRYHPRARAVDIGLSEPPPGLPEVVADPGRMRQVFVNLLLNAADALHGRGRIEVALAAAAGGVEVSVRDDGPGVPPADRAHLFDPFYTTKPAGQGTGLGLAICQRLVEEAGGRIWLAEEAGPGATFKVWLPAAG